MKKFVRLACMLLCAAMLLNAIAGCGSSVSKTTTTEEEEETTRKTTTEKETEKKTEADEDEDEEDEESDGEEAKTEKTTKAEKTTEAEEETESEKKTEKATAEAKTTEAEDEEEDEGAPAWGTGEGEGDGPEEDEGEGGEGTENEATTKPASGGGQASGGAYIPAAAGPAPAMIDFSDAGLPTEAKTFPDAQWNYMDYFWVRAIAYVDAEIDPENLSEDWPEESKFFGVFFQAVCIEFIKEYTDISGGDFRFGGPGLNNRIYGSLKPSGSVRYSFSPKEIGEVGYCYSLFAADSIDDITQVWHKYSIKNEETDSYDYFYNYMTSMPFANLIVNERPAEFDYYIPYTATYKVSDWSEPLEDPPVKIRTLAYDLYPLLERDRPDFLRRNDKIYVIYFEAENLGDEELDYKSVSIDYGGTGVAKVSIWMSEFTLYSSSFDSGFKPGERRVFISAFYCEELEDLKTIKAGYGKEAPEIPFDFS